jgi:hypothetical protein
MSFDGQKLVLRQVFVKKPCRSAGPAQIGVRKRGIRWLCRIDWMIFFNRDRCRTIWLRSCLRAPMNVIVFQRPNGALPFTRASHGPHPRSGVMLVFVHVSSMKTRRFASIRP